MKNQIRKNNREQIELIKTNIELLSEYGYTDEHIANSIKRQFGYMPYEVVKALSEVAI